MKLQKGKGIADASEYYTAMKGWFPGCKGSFCIVKDAPKSVYSLHQRYKIKGVEEIPPNKDFEAKGYHTEERFCIFQAAPYTQVFLCFYFCVLMFLYFYFIGRFFIFAI